ncbi:Ninein-like protein [Frankliniella fusca]|uniref:Ninein-like protein n=1 Tax=Frankliniella fusca TaxID=407009 RepID=A0AAE1H690_9NEOP|nr:Ninein-like protein [Frankliniella fusca]
MSPTCECTKSVHFDLGFPVQPRYTRQPCGWAAIYPGVTWARAPCAGLEESALTLRSPWAGAAASSGDGEQPDCPGAIMPDDPLVEGGAPEGGDPDMGEQQYWRCPHCDISMPQGAVLALLRRVGEDLSDLDKDDPEACRLFLQRYGGDQFPLDLKEKDAERRPLLSRQHFYLTDVRLALAQRYGKDGDDAQQGLRQLTDGELAHKRQLCRDLLKLADKLVPAEHRMRGLLWFELHAAEVEASRRRGLDQGPDPEALRVSLLESRRCLTEVVELLRCEPPDLPEGKVLRQARLNLKEVDQLLCALHHAVGRRAHTGCPSTSPNTAAQRGNMKRKKPAQVEYP